MKYKIIGLIACFSIVTVSLLNLPVLLTNESTRYHQHIEAGRKENCNHVDNIFCTHLPLVEINTNGVQIPGKALKENAMTVGYTTAADGTDRIYAQMEVTNNEKTNNHTNDIPTVASRIEIHVRGNSSRSFDKSSYRINLITEEGTNNRQSLAGMDAHHEWALHGPFLDKTLLRNYMWYNIGGAIMDYAPNVRFCELMLNGEYEGVYVLTEIITAGKDGSRLNLSVDKKDNTFTGYLLLLDRPDGIEYNHLPSFTSYTLRTQMKLEVAYPGASNLTPELRDSIKRDFSAFEKALYSFDFDNNTYGYDDYIDVQSFVDYFLINELTCNYDAGWLSTYIYKDVNGKFRMCLWDFNSACDAYQESKMYPSHFEMQNSLWYVMLIKDKNFTDKIVSRYHELRNTYFDEEYLNIYMDDIIEYLGPAIERNYEKWGYSFDQEYDMLKPSERNPRSYKQAVNQMKEFLHERIEWMDENIDTIKQYSAKSKIRKYDENAN